MARLGCKQKAWAPRACLLAGMLANLLLGVGTAEAWPRWIASKRFWVGLSIVSAASLADGATTQNCLRRDACWERDPVFGRYPSPARIYGEGAAFDVATAYAIWKARPREGRAALAGFISLEIFDSVQSTRR